MNGVYNIILADDKTPDWAHWLTVGYSQDEVYESLVYIFERIIRGNEKMKSDDYIEGYRAAFLEVLDIVGDEEEEANKNSNYYVSEFLDDFYYDLQIRMKKDISKFINEE